MKNKSIITKLITAFKENSFTLKQAYEICPNNNPESVRARIYETLGELFERVSKGVYEATIDGLQTIMIEGDGRDLSFLSDKSVDAIITDYPWNNKSAHKGGNRNFANEYENFDYTLDDFLEKARVLKDGSFLVEFMPLESESNWKELARIKMLAVEAGFLYYAKVPYLENKIRNTGRTSKAGGDILIFTKGKARNLRPDQKKNKANSVTSGFFMSGASGMLPIKFDAPLETKHDLIHQNQKSLSLLKTLISFFSEEGDLILDQFSGSFVTSIACSQMNRMSIGIEICSNAINNAYEYIKSKGLAAVKLVKYNDVENGNHSMGVFEPYQLSFDL